MDPDAFMAGLSPAIVPSVDEQTAQSRHQPGNSMNGSREQTLSRIREALRTPGGPPPHQPSEWPSDRASFRAHLPPVGTTERERVDMFAGFAQRLRADFRECDGLDAAGQHLGALATESGWTRVAAHRGSLCDALAAALPSSVAVCLVEDGIEAGRLETCDAGVTECECLVAQTGSVCISAMGSGGRALSVLPPHHVVIARRSQIVPDLCAAYEWLAARYANDWPSFIGFVTGPSRTGDIERILVLGAHGPKRLTILLVP
jgi:L-lactate dehydrogenase complex protein LldG